MGMCGVTAMADGFPSAGREVRGGIPVLLSKACSWLHRAELQKMPG